MKAKQTEHLQASLQVTRPKVKATFNVMFIIQKGKLNNEGKAPILTRITVNGEMCHISTKLYTLPERWQSKEYKTVGLTRQEKLINTTLEELRSAIHNRYYELINHGEVVTASKIKNSMFSLDKKSMGLLTLCDKFIADYEALTIAQNYGHESLFRYKLIRSRLEEFLTKSCKMTDIPLADINKHFLDKLFLWLRSEKKLGNNTATKFMHRISSIFKMARDNGWVTGDPFKLQKLHLDKVDRGYLTQLEIENMYKKEFATPRLELIRDLFIFSCYTGFAYIDVAGLTTHMLKTWPDGNVWISSHRKKTKVPVNIRLLNIPLQIIEKYRGQAKGDKLLPVPSNQKCNDYLKEIAAVCGINKELCFHMARHTFATTITLSNGVPIESVSKMLGHTNIKTTHIYARITDQKVNKDMEILAEKLNGTLPETPTKSAKSTK